MNLKAIEYLKAKEEHLKQWLEHVKNSQNKLPLVLYQLELIKWELNALTDCPDEADEASSGTLADNLNRDYEYSRKAFPLPPNNNDTAVLSSMVAFSSAGASGVYALVARFGDLDVPVARTYSSKHTKLYQNIQATQHRREEVRNLISKLQNPQTLERFDMAYNIYASSKVDENQRIATAATMRNLLYGLQGDLFQMARVSSRENMTWSLMAERLCKGSKGGNEEKELLSQDLERSSLINNLSTVLKDREGSSRANLDNIWTQLLDHLFIVLTLIKQ